MVKKQDKKQDKTKTGQEEVFLKEIKEEVYKEQLHKLFVKYSKQIAIVSAIVVILVVGSVISNNRRTTKEEKFSKKLYEAMLDVRQQQYAEAQANLENMLESSIPSTTKSLVELKLAQVLNMQGEHGKALELYLNIKDNRKYDSFVRDFAGLSALNLMIMDHNPTNEAKIEKLIKKLEKTKTGSLKYLVMEQKVLYARTKGNIDEANAIIDEILKDENTPHTIRLRVMEMKEVHNFIKSQKK